MRPSTAVPTAQHTVLEEVVLLDAHGSPVGVADKRKIHGSHTPLHLAFSCYGFDSGGRLLVTRRSFTKAVFPGVWSNTCCGHPSPGEQGETAVRRRLAQELSLIARDITLVLPRFRYRAEMDGVVENELCPVYLCRLEKQPTPDPDEVAEVRWQAWDEYVELATGADSVISVWSRLQVAELETGGHVSRFLSV